MNQRSDVAPILSLLTAFARRARWQALAGRMLDALAILGIGLPLLSLIDEYVPISALLRELLFDLLTLLAASRMIPAAARLMTRRVDWVRTAERLEACAPWLQQRLSTIMSQPDNASTLANQLLAATFLSIQQHSKLIGECTPWKPIIRRVILTSGVGIVTLLLAHWFGGSPGRFLPPWPSDAANSESIIR